MATALARFWYNVLLIMVAIVGAPYWINALLQSKHRAIILKRCGMGLKSSGIHQSMGRPIWIHALSVGEVQSAAPLIEALQKKSLTPIVISASTQTGYETAQRLFRRKAQQICFFPYDIGWVVRRTLRQVNPRLFIIIETDLWPNFLFELQHQKIPAVFVNARLSSGTLAGYSRIKTIFRQALQAFHVVCAQSDLDGSRFMQLGISEQKLRITGNLKYDHPAVTSPDRFGQRLRIRLGLSENDMIFVAGSTHRGEDNIVVEAFFHLRKKYSGLKLIIAPRHLNRSRTLFDMVAAFNLKPLLLSGFNPTQDSFDADALIVNAMGLLESLYAAADVAFVGGSLVRIGGHNPIEPAILGKPTLFGPHMGNCLSVAEQLIEGGGASYVNNKAELIAKMETLLADKQLRSKSGQNALSVILANQGAVDRTIRVIEQLDEDRCSIIDMPYGN